MAINYHCLQSTAVVTFHYQDSNYQNITVFRTVASRDDDSGFAAPACRQQESNPSPRVACIYATPEFGFDSCCLHTDTEDSPSRLAR